jgi:23S rRNA (uridine2552-2'-O)-methyltransferase
MQSKKNKTNRSWINRHVTDHYVKMAKSYGYRSRAVFKLKEIVSKFKLFTQVGVVVDLGCAPGSWLQYTKEQLGNKSIIIGVDLLAIEPLNAVKFIQGDFTNNQVLTQLGALLTNKTLDLILCDMSPNLSGIKDVDQSRMSWLIEMVLEFAKNNLKPAGNCVMKVFQGSQLQQLKTATLTIFSQVDLYKPDSSRDESSEIYIIARNKKDNAN